MSGADEQPQPAKLLGNRGSGTAAAGCCGLEAASVSQTMAAVGRIVAVVNVACCNYRGARGRAR